MICEEFGKDLTPETCAATKRNGWCDRSCEEQKLPKNGNGQIEKSSQALPKIIVQDSQISEITPKEGQSTSDIPKTILGHSGKKKAQIEGLCQRRNEKLIWNACLQRKHRGISLCESCDPNKEFLFSEQPMGQGWHNSAKRAGEMVCPELDGRKLKKSTCVMRQGKRRKMGKSCDCQFWKGEKIVGEMKNQKCSLCQGEFVGLGEICQPCLRGEDRQVLAPEPVNPNHVKLMAISNALSDLLYRHSELTIQREELEEEIKKTASEIVAELQKAVKEVDGQ